MIAAGQTLRKIREQLGFTIREVEAASLRIAAKHQNDDFAIPLSRLSDIETKGVVPSVFRLYSFSIIYRRDLREMMSWYGIDVNETAGDLPLVEPPNSHKSNALSSVTNANVPVKIDPEFDLKRTTNLGRIIRRWGVVPLLHLTKMEQNRFAYGYVGSEDLTMYPLLLPGSFVQIDESRNKVQERTWHSEYERPIYFVETREGFVCSWCAVVGDSLMLQPHPLSPVPPRSLKQPSEAEILGQVVGIAMRLDSRISPATARPPSSERERLP